MAVAPAPLNICFLACLGAETKAELLFCKSLDIGDETWEGPRSFSWALRRCVVPCLHVWEQSSAVRVNHLEGCSASMTAKPGEGVSLGHNLLSGLTLPYL
jgi:hypothetical protein